MSSRDGVGYMHSTSETISLSSSLPAAGAGGAISAGEVNHRVKNSLAIVASLLRLQAKTADPAARDALRQAADRIHAVAALHENLSKPGSRDVLNAADYLRELCSGLSSSLLDARRVTLSLRAEPVPLPAQTAQALGLIVNELVTNAAKHAYPAQGAGEIRVGLELRGGKLILEVADDGRGMPAMRPVRSGLGMGIVGMLAGQLDGEVTIHPGPGARVTLVCPAPVGRLN
jgi:two-component sensor histidine kinase